MSFSRTSRVRFLSLDRLYFRHRGQYVDAIERSLASGNAVGGAEVERFEARLAERSRRKHAIAVSSGTDAMMVLLAALGVTRDWTFFVPAYTFVATASPLLHRGVAPSFVDVDEFYHLDINALSERTPSGSRRAMIAVGLFGQSVDYARFEQYCEEMGILLLEDAAQSYEAYSNGRPGGNLGVASTFSFAPTKVLPCFGNLGAIVTDDDDLAGRARSIRYHGRSAEVDDFVLPGYNALPSSIAAAMLNISMDHFAETQTRRVEIAEIYCRELSVLEELELPKVRSGTISNWHKFVVRHPRRDALRNHLLNREIETQVHYSRALPDSKIFLVRDKEDFPTARRLARESLTLPLHAQMTDGEVSQVIDALIDFRGA